VTPAASGRGDLLALEDNLAGFWRLRVGRQRVMVASTETEIRCLFVEERRLVYEIFAALLHKGLSTDRKLDWGRRSGRRRRGLGITAPNSKADPIGRPAGLRNAEGKRRTDE